MRQISGDDCEIIGASRTDSGAHALGQVCHFDTENPMPVERWPRVVNQLLPSDLAVTQAEEVDPEFHSRFWADRRVYRYRIQTGLRDPLKGRYVCHHSKPVDTDRMQKAARDLVGEHDFRGFSQELTLEDNTVRTLYSVDVTQQGDEVWIDVAGTAFVRGMMRRISGALLEIGRGARDPQSLKALLADPHRPGLTWPQVLPAWGLMLMKVEYGENPVDHRQFSVQKQEDEDE